jgi:NADH dehydrogenase FAD-containing subunit
MGNNIYILGGGLSGIYAKAVNKNSKLIDKSENITISTRLIDIINGDPESYAYKPRHVDFLDEIAGIDFGNREIAGKSRHYSYDKLIIAIGHTQNFKAIDGYKYIQKLETVEDALTIRNKISISKNITIIGGGYLGVEIASLINGKNVSIIDSNDRLLSRTGTEASKYVTDMLNAMGCNILTSTKVLSVGQKSVNTDKNEIESDLTIYAGGITGNSLINNLDIKSRNSKIVVNKNLQSIQYDDVYAAGDSMSINGYDYPMSAYIARKSGIIAMKNASGSNTNFNVSETGNIININGKYIMVNSKKISKGFLVNQIKKYVNRRTDRTLNKYFISL